VVGSWGPYVDWNVILVDVNQWFDRLDESAAQPNWRSRRDAFEKLEGEIAALAPSDAEVLDAIDNQEARTGVLGALAAYHLLPNLSNLSRVEGVVNTQWDLLQLAAALAIFRIDQGAYPESLDALPDEPPDEQAAQFADLPRVDLYSGAALVYRRTGDGYLLYSVGPNGADEGGDNKEHRTAQYYQGYNLNEYRAREVLAATGGSLDDLPNGSIGELAVAIDEPASGRQIEEYLLNRISTQADDIAIRMPPIREKWPHEQAGEAAAVENP
jgi:hypothetical protein